MYFIFAPNFTYRFMLSDYCIGIRSSHKKSRKILGLLIIRAPYQFLLCFFWNFLKFLLNFLMNRPFVLQKSDGSFYAIIIMQMRSFTWVRKITYIQYISDTPKRFGKVCTTSVLSVSKTGWWSKLTICFLITLMILIIELWWILN